MTLRACNRDSELVVALRRGAWPLAVDTGLRQHVENCRDCRQTVLVAQSLMQAAVAPPPTWAPRPVSAGSLWWRAQLQRRYLEVKRVERPLALAESAGLLAFLAVTGLLLYWQSGAIWSWLHTLPQALATGTVVAAVAAGVATLALAGVVACRWALRD